MMMSLQEPSSRIRIHRLVMKPPLLVLPQHWKILKDTPLLHLNRDTNIVTVNRNIDFMGTDLCNSMTFNLGNAVFLKELREAHKKLAPHEVHLAHYLALSYQHLHARHTKVWERLSKTQHIDLCIEKALLDLQVKNMEKALGNKERSIGNCRFKDKFLKSQITMLNDLNALDSKEVTSLEQKNEDLIKKIDNLRRENEKLIKHTHALQQKDKY